MKLSVCAQSIENIESDALILGIAQDSKLGRYFPGERLQGLADYLDAMVAEEEVTGAQEEVTIIQTFGQIKPKRLVVVGLGNIRHLTLDRFRCAAAVAGRKMRQIKCRHVALSLDGIPVSFSKEDIACAMVEGFLMGTYRVPKFSNSPKAHQIEQLTFCTSHGNPGESIEQAVYTGKVLAQATNYTRDIVNAPSNLMTPERLAELAVEMAQSYQLDCRIFDEREMERMGMNLILAVARGSARPPRLIILNYQGDPDNPHSIGILGKGVTFDSGGLSLKGGKGMHKMKADLTGGAIAMAVIKALALLKSKINAVAVIPSVENMPSSDAYKPGDVYMSYGGKSVEILNTDAEGRLILADSLSYMQQDLGLHRIIDIATLTGGAIRALGSKIIATFSNDDNLYQLFEEGCWHSGEYCWRMPLFSEYRDMLKSDIADIRNLSYQPPSTIEGALFLQYFIEKQTSWMHLDIANVDFTDSPWGYVPKGATGIGIRSLVRMLLHLNEQDFFDHPPYQAPQYGKLWREYPKIDLYNL